MSSPIIEVSDLSKSYIITHEGKEKYTALRDVMSQKVKKIFSFSKPLSKGSDSKEEFWALKDINFDINQGDRVGIIGRNGAGKSTLLKILSRITEPTTGQIKIRGRVASLLEVGTGFHPELSGRENIFLNGAILGMSRMEIKKHFDAIVDFAEVEKFLDTPVKRYSSGMYVRLAFAVAAHLEPEILIVDEVLAVGDAQFQKKCLGKMEDVSKNEGRTVLFVSHYLQAIKKLCTSGIYLSEGRVAYSGGIKEVVEKYYLSTSDSQSGIIAPNLSTYNTGVAKITKCYVRSDGGAIFFSEKILIDCEIRCKDAIGNLFVDCRINSIDLAEIAHCTHLYEKENKSPVSLKAGNNQISIEIENIFQPGNYSLTLGVHKMDGTTLDFIEQIGQFEVLAVAKDGNDFVFPSNWELGKVRVDSKWQFHD